MLYLCSCATVKPSSDSSFTTSETKPFQHICSLFCFDIVVYSWALGGTYTCSALCYILYTVTLCLAACLKFIWYDNVPWILFLHLNCTTVYIYKTHKRDSIFVLYYISRLQEGVPSLPHQQAAFMMAPPPPWKQQINNTTSNKATNMATPANPSNGTTSSGELSFSLTRRASGTAKTGKWKRKISRSTGWIFEKANIPSYPPLPLFVSEHFLRLQFLHFFLLTTLRFFVKDERRRFAVHNMCAARVCRCVFPCVCVGFSDKTGLLKCGRHCRFFVGWLTAPRRCQAPTAETTKRRIRLALEPQIFSPPPSLLLFSPSLFSLRGTPFTLVGVWLDLATFTSTRKFINLSLFCSDLMGGGGGVENMAPETPQAG